MRLGKSALIAIGFTMLFFTCFCVGQNQPTDELMWSDLSEDRVALITEAMDFSSKDAAAFWPIYREYEKERSTLEDRRAGVIKRYADNYLTLRNDEAKVIADEVFYCDSHLLSVKIKYFKRFNKVLPAYTVTKFFQLEHRIDLILDAKLAPSLPPLTRTKKSGNKASGGSN